MKNYPVSIAYSCDYSRNDFFESHDWRIFEGLRDP